MSDLIGELSTPSDIAGSFDGDIIAAKTYAKRAEAAAERAEETIPSIGDNGNWFVGSVDTGVSVTGPQGPQGEKGEKGDTGAAGPKYELTDADKNSIAQSVLNSLTAAEGVYA